MPTERKDEGFAGRVMVRMLSCILVPGLFALPVMLTLSTPIQAWQIAVLVGAPVTTAVVGCVLMYRLYSRYRCPQCGTRLPALPMEAASRHEQRFHCQTCDVVWTTGVFHGEN